MDRFDHGSKRDYVRRIELVRSLTPQSQWAPLAIGKAFTRFPFSTQDPRENKK